jgi:uncharacterized protein
MTKRCSVACDTDCGVLVCELELPEQASIADALAAARPRLGAGVADWEHAATGIYGQIFPREHVPADGDRIELYRALQIDPRARRRAQAAAARAPQRRRGTPRA